MSILGSEGRSLLQVLIRSIHGVKMKKSTREKTTELDLIRIEKVCRQRILQFLFYSTDETTIIKDRISMDLGTYRKVYYTKSRKVRRSS